MAQPLPPEPPRPPEALDRTTGTLDVAELDDDREPGLRLLPEPPEHKVTGPRPRPGLRKKPAVDETPMPARGAGMTITSYLIAGILAYGLIGWVTGRAVHLPILTAAGMLAGLGISISLIIYRYGRSTPPRIRRFAPRPASGPNDHMTKDNDARGTDR